MVRLAVRMWAGGKEKAWIWGKRLGAKGDALIKKQRNQRKGKLMARKKFEIQGGTCPLLREAQGTNQEKKKRLKDRRQVTGHVSTRLSSTHCARHHL